MFDENTPSPIWRRALGAASLLLVLHMVSPALANDAAVPAQPSEAVESPPPPGTYRLIRIGPQALVKEDDHGNVTMVEEPVEKPRRGQRVVNVLMGVLTAGAVLTLGRNQLTSEVGGRAGPP